MTDFERLAKIAEVFNYKSMRSFANAAGLKVQTFYDIQAGRCKISQRVAEAINEKFNNVSLSWLLTGEGEMYLKENSSEGPDGRTTATPEDRDNPSLNTQLTKLIESSASLAESNRILAEANKVLAESNKILLESNRKLLDSMEKNGKDVRTG